MRIGTIHAFCQSLLRRFPLEAAITPHFQLVEEADARLTMEGAREAVLAEASEAALQGVAGLAKAEQFGRLVECLDAQRERIAPLLGASAAKLAEAVRRTAGAEAKSEAELMRRAVAWPGEDGVRRRAACSATRTARRRCAITCSRCCTGSPCRRRCG